MSTQNSTNDIYDKIFIRLFYPMLLYLPKYLTDVFKVNKKLNVFENLVGILFCFENEDYNFVLDDNSNLVFLMNKAKYIERNMFDLIDAKETLKSKQFQFLLTKYKTQVDLWTFASALLQKDIETTTSALFVQNKGYINYQATILQQHQNNLEEHFEECERTIDDFDLKSLLLKNIEKEKNKATENQQKSNKKPRLKKQPIISDSEADAYLLKHVFKVTTED